jgi:hypothetical protein
MKDLNKPSKGNGKTNTEKGQDSLQKEGESLFQDAMMANAVETIKHNFSTYLQQIFLFNKLRKAKYDNLISEGFTEVQALEIIIRTKIFE